MICEKCKKRCEMCGDEIIINKGQIIPKEPWKYELDKGNNIIPCLHKSCPGCRNGTCSGVHMISCPCPNCSPTCM